MADNRVELVVVVETDKANQSIKSVNASLSSLEQHAVNTARRASSGIDGMTASMVKGATAGNLLADAIKQAIQWAKEWTIDAAKAASHVERLENATLALAKAHGVNAQAVTAASEAVQRAGYENEDALQTVNKLIIAGLELEKAQGLAKAAKDLAALKDNLSAADALESMLQAIEFGNARAMRTVGLKVEFDKQIELAELRKGKALAESEKVQIRYNAVMREAAKAQGAGAAAAQGAESQIKALSREVNDLKESVGKQFQDEFKAVVGWLRDMVKWLGENTDLLEKFGRVAMWVSGILATYALATKIMALAKSIAALNLASMNPYALLATGVLAAGAIVYTNFKDTQEQLQNRYEEMGRDAMRKDFASGKLTLGDLRKKGMTDDQIRELMSGRSLPGEIPWEYTGPRISIKGLPGAPSAAGSDGGGDDAEIARLKVAREIRKHQLGVERESQESVVAAGAQGLTGFAREVAEINARIEKWTTFKNEDGSTRRVALTAKAWENVIDEFQKRFTAYKEHLLEENRKHLAEIVKDDTAARAEKMQKDREAFVARLQYEREMLYAHMQQSLQLEEQRLGRVRDAKTRELEGFDTQTIEQKVWVENRKAEIEIDHLERVHVMKEKLFDLETSRMVQEEQIRLKQLGYQTREIELKLAELSQQREEIRQANQEATDDAIEAARTTASNRTTAIIRDHDRQVFDSFKRQAEGVFDALLSKSQTIWSAIGNSLKTALLTAIKEVVTSRVAAMLMQLFTGQKVSFAVGGTGASGGGWGGILGGLGGSVPVFGVPNWPGSAPGGTPPIIPGPTGVPIGASNSGAGSGMSGFGGWGSIASSYKGFLTRLGNIGYGPKGGDFGGEVAGSYRGVGGAKGGAMLAGGSILVIDGLRRGGWAGVGETTAGGALIGAKFGGPLGAAIGAIAGFAAGMIRKYWIKGAVEKAREKIKATYGVDVSDMGVLTQIVNTAKQTFGGNLDMAIRSKDIRDMIELYAMSTGQKPTGMPGAVRSLDLVQSGGSLYQSPGYTNGSSLPGLGGLPALDRVGGGAASNAGPLVIQLDGPATTALLRGEAVQAIVDNPRAVQSATMSAARSNVGRRELTSLQLSPGTLTA